MTEMWLSFSRRWPVRPAATLDHPKDGCASRPLRDQVDDAALRVRTTFDVALCRCQARMTGQLLNVRPRGFVIVNQVIIAANGLNKPDCRGIAYPEVPRGMHRSAGFDLQRTDPLLRFHVFQRIGVDRAKDGRRELAEIFLSEVGIPLNLAI